MRFVAGRGAVAELLAGRGAVAELLAGSAMAKRIAALWQRAIGKRKSEEQERNYEKKAK